MTLTIDQGLAFLEGVALVASPCILPILPLILSASIEGGRSRPVGIIVGFIASFCMFAFFSRYLVTWIGIDLDVIKVFSLILLAILGVVMLSTRLTEFFGRFTQRLSDVGNRFAPATAGGGFWTGVGIGILIGLIWTPCAGPILAAVLVEVLRQQDSVQAFVTLLCFAIGVGIPMFVIAFAGQHIATHMTFFKTHAVGLRKTLGAVILLSVYVIAAGINPSDYFPDNTLDMTNTTETTDTTGATMLSNPYPAPEFSGIETWLNSQPLTMASLRGKVVLIDFWTYSCINCVRTLPFVTSLDQRYRAKGLVVIGVHAPEFEFEKKVDNIQHAIEKYHIKYPVAVDSGLKTWDNFHNRYWPAQYLIDQKGNIVYTHFGEGGEATMESNIQHLLGISMPIRNEIEPANNYNQTPETYLGDMRAERFLRLNAQTGLPLHGWSVDGRWIHGREYITSDGPAVLWLHFKAKKVFLVMGTTTNKPITVQVLLNGLPVLETVVDRHTLYPLIEEPYPKEGYLELRVNEPGLALYAFTFG